MTGRHAGALPPDARAWMIGLTAGLVLGMGMLIWSFIAALLPSAASPVSTTTVRVPGPTVTVSYLIIRTATPGVGGF